MKALIITWISLIIISITYLKTANRTIRSIERENEHESLSKVEEESEKAVYKD